MASQRHPQYDDYSLAYDFLVLRLNSAVPDTYQPVVLNTKPNNYREPVDNEQLTVIGMGVTDVKHNTISDFLLATNVNYIADCERESKYENGDVQEDIMFCAGHPKGDTDSCQGKNYCFM